MRAMGHLVELYKRKQGETKSFGTSTSHCHKYQDCKEMHFFHRKNQGVAATVGRKLQELVYYRVMRFSYETKSAIAAIYHLNSYRIRCWGLCRCVSLACLIQNGWLWKYQILQDEFASTFVNGWDKMAQ